MTGLSAVTRSMRSVRVSARAPRILVLSLIVILCVAGLRAIVERPPQQTIVSQAAPGPPQLDLGAEAFAEAFARAYLTFDAGKPDAREAALSPYVGESLASDDGLLPAVGSRQTVSWVTVVGERRTRGRIIVTVQAKTSAGVVFLSVPVARDRRGLLSIPDRPAFVGPPATNTEETPSEETPVNDEALTAVVGRALTNYLERAQSNLLADLAPEAVISLPTEAMRVKSLGGVAWIVPGRRVAVEVEVKDARKNAWALRYELEVTKSDRWYVRSLQVDPTFQRGD